MTMKKFRWSYKETTLNILLDREEALESIKRSVIENRIRLEDYIEKNPLFKVSLVPIDVDEDSPDIVREMAHASKKVGVGPMACVAGAFSEFSCKSALNHAKNILVENGGDIYIHGERDFKIGIYAGHSKFSNRIGFYINEESLPIGICTSSGTVGHSISFGESDATVVVAKSAILADAAATAIGNVVRGKKGLKKGLNFAKKIEGIEGVLIIHENRLGAWGNLPEIIDVREERAEFFVRTQNIDDPEGNIHKKRPNTKEHEVVRNTLL